MRFDARQIAGLCNGSTPDSDSVCEGSNPSPAAKQKAFHIRPECGTLSLFSWFSPASLFPVGAVPLCCSSQTIYTNHQLKCATHILIGDWYETYFRDAYIIIAKMPRRYGVENRLK